MLQRLAPQMQAAVRRAGVRERRALRDRIRALAAGPGAARTSIRRRWTRPTSSPLHQAGGQACVQVFFFRAGQNWGNRAYFPRLDQELDAEPRSWPPSSASSTTTSRRRALILVEPRAGRSASCWPRRFGLKAGRKVEIAAPQRGDKREAGRPRLTNAREALGRQLAESSAPAQAARRRGARPSAWRRRRERIEVYDNCHIMGTQRGRRHDRRRARRLPEERVPQVQHQDATELTPGDDYGMMREVLRRRFAPRAKEEPERERGTWPDLVLIDGGAGPARGGAAR